MLGLAPAAPSGGLAIDGPALPEWLGRVELRRLRIGKAVVAMAFERDSAATGFSLLEQKGALRVTMTV
jgi:hypothetical protein